MNGIEAWPQLREWLEKHRVFLLQRAEIEAAMARSERERRDPEFLLPGKRLARAVELVNERPDLLLPGMRAFITASSARAATEEAGRRDASRMAALRLVANDPARLAALLREFEDPRHARGWMECAAGAVREVAWHHAVPGDPERSYAPLAFNRDGSVLAARVFDGFGSHLLLWRVRQIGRPQSIGFGDEDLLWLGFDRRGDRLLTLSQRAVLRVFRIEVGPDLRAEGVLDDVELSSQGETTHFQRIGVVRERETRGLPDGFEADRDGIRAVAYAAEAQRLLTCHRDGAVRVWNLKGCTAPARLPWSLDPPVRYDVTLSPDGVWAVFLDRGSHPPHPRYGPAYLMCVDPGREGHIRPLDGGVCAAAFRHDGTFVVTAGKDGSARVWPVSPGAAPPVEFRAGGAALTAVAFSNDGTRIAAGSEDGILSLWPFTGNEPPVVEPRKGWTPELVLRSGDLMTYRYSRPPGCPTVRRAHPGELRSIVFAPGDRRVLTTSSDGTARTWRTDGGPAAVLRAHEGGAIGAILSPDGRSVATTCRAKTPHVWDADRVGEPAVLRPPPWVHGGVARLAVESSEGGDRVWTEFSDGHIRVSSGDGTGEEETTEFEYLERSGRDRTIHTDPKLRWRCEQADGLEARFVPIRGPRERAPLVLRGITDKLRSAAATVDGRRILGITAAGTGALWDVDDPSGPAPFGDGNLCAAAFSDDGRWIAAGAQDGVVRVWAADGSTEPVLVGRLSEPVNEVEFSPDGTWVLARNWSRQTLIGWANGQGAKEIGAVSAIRFIRGGQTALAVFSDAIAEIEPNFSFRILRQLGPEFYQAKAISPCGRWILTQSANRDPLVWSTDPDIEPVVLRGAGDATVFTPNPDGSRLLTGHRDGAVLIWSIDLEPDSLKERLWRATPYCLTVKERMQLLAEDLETARRNRDAALAKAVEYHSKSLPGRGRARTRGPRGARAPSRPRGSGS